MSNFPAELTGTWVIDAGHSTVGFAVKHAMVSTTRGKFNSFSGEATIDAANPEASSAFIEIDATSVDTGSEQRDGHLRSPDFWDAENNPKITFRSTSAKLDGDDLILTGDLTIKASPSRSTSSGSSPASAPTRGAPPRPASRAPRRSTAATGACPGTRPWRPVASWSPTRSSWSSRSRPTRSRPEPSGNTPSVVPGRSPCTARDRPGTPVLTAGEHSPAFRIPSPTCGDHVSRCSV